MDSKQQIEALQAALDLKDRILDLIMKVDSIRDTAKNPAVMMSEIVELIASDYQTDLCFIALLNRETEQVEMQAVEQRPDLEAKYVNALTKREVIAHVLDFEEVTIWERDQHPPLIGNQLDADIAIVPISLKANEPLGVMLLVCREKSFTAGDIESLTYIEDHIDSAVIQGQTYYELVNRNQQLELIAKIDQIRDLHLPIDEMLELVVNTLIADIPSEQGFAMLYDEGTQKLILRVSTDADYFASPEPYRQILEFSEKTLIDGGIIVRNELDIPQMGSIMCLPLILSEKIIGVLGLINRKTENGFLNQDVRLHQAAGSQIDTALYETMEKRHLREVLGRAVGPRIMDRILHRDSDVLKSERMMITVLYADIRESTQMTMETEPEILVAFMNDYLHTMNQIVLEYDGTLDKFVGDEVMALFGAPIPQEDHALRALKVAQDMLVAHAEIIERWRKRGVNARPIGIGIATGELIVGEMGSTQRTDYTVMGHAANLGARICSIAPAGKIYICPETHRLTAAHTDAIPLEPMTFKGIKEKTTIYQVAPLVSTLLTAETDRRLGNSPLG